MVAVVGYKNQFFENWWSIYVFAKKSNVKIGYYYATFLDKYYTFLRRSISDFAFIQLVSWIKLDASEVFERAVLDTLLLDSLVFSNCYTNRKQIKALLSLWQSTLGTSYKDDLRRNSLPSIQYRFYPLVTLLLSHRYLKYKDKLAYKSFFINYFTLRQLSDDLSDVQQDKLQHIQSFAINYGSMYTRQVIKNIILLTYKLDIPLFYKELIRLYEKNIFHYI